MVISTVDLSKVNINRVLSYAINFRKIKKRKMKTKN